MNKEHIKSKLRRQMTGEERAAQFAPFAALVGFEDKIHSAARITERKIELDEYEVERINLRLSDILRTAPAIPVYISYFVRDMNSMGGRYLKEKFHIKAVSEYDGTLTTKEGIVIALDDIIDIEDV